MDAISDSRIREVVVMAGAQIGKTEILLNIIGFHVDFDAAPILVLQPTLEMAQAFSKDRVAPMLRDTPALRGKVKDPRSRDANNTTTHKVFPGGHLTMVGSNSAAGLASRPIRLVLADEVDRYPASAGTEGDPISLAKKRSATYWNRKIVMVSTPTNKGASRIETAYEETDQRKFFVPCQHCGHEQHLVWANVKWEKDRPDTAGYMCDSCGVVWNDNERNKAVRQGKWVATGPNTEIAGFHINGIYSPWTQLSDAVKEFLSAKKLPDTLRVWTNTYLAESWDSNQGDGADEYDVMERAEDPTPHLDQGVLMLTCGIDCQGDRLEYEVLGIGRDEETWSVDYGILYGDPSGPQIWRDLDDVLNETWTTEDGRELTIRAACIDSGGHHTQQVYNYVRPREAKRVFAIKGMAGESRAVVSRPSKNNIGKVRLYTLGVDNIKAMVLARLKIREPGPGYCHFPNNRDEEYFKQLAASERIVTKFHKGFPKREFVKVRTRNEALDCRVYAIGAYAIWGQNINRLADQVHKKQELPEKQKKAKLQSRRSGGFVKNW